MSSRDDIRDGDWGNVSSFAYAEPSRSWVNYDDIRSTSALDLSSEPIF